MAGNVIVTTTSNRVIFDVDNGSYGKAIKKIRQVKKEWEKVGQKVSDKKFTPAPTYAKAAADMKKVNKRLEETRRKEAQRSTDHSIALAKKEARAREQINKQSSARIRQTMKSMTASNPEMAKMKAFYKQMERDSKKASRSGSGWSSPNRVTQQSIAAALASRSKGGIDSAGNGMAVSSEAAARAASMLGGRHKAGFDARSGGSGSTAQSKSDARRAAAQAAARAKREAAQAAMSRKRDDVVGQTDVRLRSRYGSGYSSKLGGGKGGVDQLNKEFKQGAISAGMYRAQIGALERQFRSASSGATSLSSVLEGVRSSLVSVGAAYGVFNAGASVLKQGQFFQGLDATMTMVSDSSDEAAKRIQFVRDQSYRLGLDLKTAAQGYTQMSVAAEGVISKSQNDELFKGFSEYATALQVDPVKYQRGIMAIGQMLGKGQIMAEELKGQLAEGIPGAMKVFVKAAQEHFKDDKIGVPELMKLMQDGKLLAKDILPYVGKEFAKAANKGGALDKALLGNRVAMQRLSQTWMNFQNDVFEGGFGQKMTDTFNILAEILSDNGALATNLGKFFKNMIQGAEDVATAVYNAFVFIGRNLDAFGKSLGIKGEMMQKIFDWAAWTGGALLMVGLMGKLLKILTAMAGLAGSLGVIKDIVTGGAGPDKKGKKTPRVGGLVGMIPWVMAGQAGVDYLEEEHRNQKGMMLNNISDSLGGTPTLGGTGAALGYNMFKDWIQGAMGGTAAGQALNMYSDTTYPAPRQTGTWPPTASSPQEVQGEIKVKIDAGELQKIIDTTIENSGMQQINMILSSTGGV